MNASAGLFATAAHIGRITRGFACAGLCLLAGACSGNPFATAKVDPTSPIVEEVNAAGRTTRPFPKFTDIPKPPNDVRPTAAFVAAAESLTDTGDELVRQTAENTWTLNDTVAFEARAQTAAGPEIAPGVQDAAATEAFARRLRERATPPPLTR